MNEDVIVNKVAIIERCIKRIGQVYADGSDLSDNLKKMVGLRNIAVHEYQELNLDILVYVINNRLSDLQQFTSIVLTLLKAGEKA